MGLLLGPLLLCLPLVGVVVASRFRTAHSVTRRRFAQVLGFFSLWIMFDLSVCATWGAFRVGAPGDMGPLLAMIVAQLVVPWLCGWIVATAPPRASGN